MTDGNTAGVLDIVAPDEKFLNGQPDLLYRRYGNQQGYKGGLLHLNQSVFQKLHMLIVAFADFLAVHPALVAVRPQHRAGQVSVMPRPAKQLVGLKQLFQRVRSREAVVVHEP